MSRCSTRWEGRSKWNGRYVRCVCDDGNECGDGVSITRLVKRRLREVRVDRVQKSDGSNSDRGSSRDGLRRRRSGNRVTRGSCTGLRGNSTGRSGRVLSRGATTQKRKKQQGRRGSGSSHLGGEN